MQGRKILLVIGGGIAAYKSLELIRRLREAGAEVECVMTQGAKRFITPLSVAALSGKPAHSDLFQSENEDAGMAHIGLTRRADLVIVAPATAHLIARLAHGLADELATALLLASNKPLLLAPAMNVEMWGAAATKRNMSLLQKDGVLFVGPEKGDTACGEEGLGRMSEAEEIAARAAAFFRESFHRPLAGLKALVTSGPTQEALDPVRYISNRSSGKQGHAIAGALAALGAETTLVSGPCRTPIPKDIRLFEVKTAHEMQKACREALPVDVAICAAAICDWRPRQSSEMKIKKNGSAPRFALEETPDILAELSRRGKKRPPLVIGFAAETEKVIDHARQKLKKKGCDWIIANDVSPESGILEGDENAVHLIRKDGLESWDRMPKDDVARRLGEEIATHFSKAAKHG